MTITATDLHGVFPPIATPFTPDGEVAHQKLAENLARWNQFALSGYVVLGSNGEFPLLNGDEKLAVLETAREAIPKEKILIAGAGEESTKETISMARKAAAVGADAVLVVPPSYYRGQMTPAVLARHYTQLAEASPIPIILYNIPAATGIDMAAGMVAELSRHPNIIGIKDTSGNLPKMGEMVKGVARDFAVLAGSASFFLPALAIGAVGGIMALANIAPRECLQLHRLAQEGRYAEARELHLRMLPVNQAITVGWGAGALKFALDLLGWYGGPPRAPLPELNEAQRAELRAMLTRSGLLKA